MEQILYFTHQSLCLHADLFGMKMIIQRVLGMYDSPPSWAGDSHMRKQDACQKARLNP